MASLADPLDLPSGVRLPNRIAKAALSEALGDADNSPDDRIVTLYRRWAQWAAINGTRPVAASRLTPLQIRVVTSSGAADVAHQDAQGPRAANDQWPRESPGAIGDRI